MKTSTYKYLFLLGIFFFVIACSTKKDSFVNRNYHALTTKYNVLYNGDMALESGINELKTTYKDNFWEILPVERMQVSEENMNPEDRKNPNFERAEEKATKAIQKHSMNIAGSEKNPQMDEAHLLLGKSRYYDNRFIPALEAFNYILYKYPNSDKIYEAKIWREKTYIKLENEETAIKNLKLLVKNDLKSPVATHAYATLAEAYINLEAIDSAAYIIKKAIITTKDNEEKARYQFILGQLYEKLNYPDSAYAAFQSVIEMNRKSPRRYVIQSHGRQALQFDYKNGDTVAFTKKYRKLLEDRENRPYLDALNHQVAVFYDKQDNDKQAVKYYNRSLRANSEDRYLTASNYRNIAEINFENAQYAVAGNYYDSTMVYLDTRTREFKNIKKKRENLVDVIKYEAIAQTNDSILHIVALSDSEKNSFFEDYIERLKKQDEIERINQLKKEQAQNPPMDSGFISDTGMSPGFENNNAKFARSSEAERAKAEGLGVQGGKNNFYFYNSSTVSYGKLEFKKRWGNRPYVENWRWASELKGRNTREQEASSDEIAKEEELEAQERYTTDFYLKQLPTSQTVIDSLVKERNFAYYQLGIIYKEKFMEYERAASRLEQLLANNPEERLVLPAHYNLYKIYEIIDPGKAASLKQKIISQYPDSRYAQILLNPSLEVANNQSPEAAYSGIFKIYEKGDLRSVLEESESLIENYTGEEIVSKFELLKANASGRLNGLEEYKKALNFVALNYPNSAEGKQAEAILKTEIPVLEKLAFNQPSTSWKIIFKFENADNPKIKELTDKIDTYIKEGYNNKITRSLDIYTLNENFVVIHGFNSKVAAQDAVTILKDYKAYKISETPIIISSEDYKVVQVKKNFTEYLALK